MVEEGMHCLSSIIKFESGVFFISSPLGTIIQQVRGGGRLGEALCAGERRQCWPQHSIFLAHMNMVGGWLDGSRRRGSLRDRRRTSVACKKSNGCLLGWVAVCLGDALM